MIKDMFLHNNIYTNSNRKRYATGLVRPKTTALFFDKIWYPSDLPGFQEIPKSIIYTEKKIPLSRLVQTKRLIEEAIIDKKDYLFNLANMGVKPNDEENASNKNKINSIKKQDSSDSSVKNLIDEITNLHINFLPMYLANTNPNIIFRPYIELMDFVPEHEYLSSYYRNTGIKAAVHRLRYIDHIDIIPIFFDYTDYEKLLVNERLIRIPSFNKSDLRSLKWDLRDKTPCLDIIEVCIDTVPMIVEENLSWEQVKEIRSDKESQQKLSRFLFWANKDFTGKSRSQITETLYMELDDYQFALNKHGISTAVGGFTTLLSGGATMLSAMSDVSNGLAPACLTISAGLIAFSSSQAIELFECKRNPIAFMYDVIKKANKT